MTTLRVDVDPSVTPAAVCVRGTRLDENVVLRSTLLSDLRSTQGSFELPVSLHAFDLWLSARDPMRLGVEDLSSLFTISMFLLDSEGVDAVASTIAQRVRHAFVEDSEAAATSCKTDTAPDIFRTHYPLCLLLEPGPALVHAVQAIAPLLTSHNELRAVAERLDIHESLPLPLRLRNHVLAATVIRSKGSLDLVTGLCHVAPPATLSHVLHNLAPCLPSCPPITHLRVPPGAFHSQATLQPVLPFLTSVTHLTMSSPADATIFLADGHHHSFPALVGITCQPCDTQDIPISAFSPSPASSASTSTATHTPAPTPAIEERQHSYTSTPHSSPAQPAAHTYAVPPPDYQHTSTSAHSPWGPRTFQKLLQLDITVPSLDRQLPLPLSHLAHLSRLAASVVPGDDTADSRGVNFPPDAPSATHAVASRGLAPAEPAPTVLQLLPRCTQLQDLTLTLPEIRARTQHAAAEHAQRVFSDVLVAVPEALQRFEALIPGCPSDVVAGLARLTALRHLGMHACHACVALMPALPHLTSLKLFVSPETGESMPALDAQRCSTIGHAALKHGMLRSFHVCVCPALRTMGWHSDPGGGPPRLSDDLMHDLMNALQELRLTGASEHACADVQFTAVSLGGDAGAEQGGLHRVGGADGRGGSDRVEGVRYLQLPLYDLCRMVSAGGLWGGASAGEEASLASRGAGAKECPVPAIAPVAQLQGLQELVVRRYASCDGGRYTADVLYAVAGLTALQRLVLGGVEGVCAALRPLRALHALSVLCLPDATATTADASGLAGAIGMLPALREVLVEIDFPPQLWEHALAGFKPRSRDQGSAYAEAEAAVEAAVGALRAQCWGGLHKLQGGPRPLRRLELTVTSIASDDFVMWLLSSGVGYCPRM